MAGFSHTCGDCQPNIRLSLMQLLLPTFGILPVQSRLQPSNEVGTRQGQEPAQLRRLQAAADAADTAVVQTAADLWDAVAAGRPHIEIRSHLDITSLKDPTADKHATLPVANLRLVQSIRGNCAAPWPEAVLDRVPRQPPLLSRLPGQCLVVTNGTLLQNTGQLWLHNLYVRNVYDLPDSGTLLVRSAAADDAAGPTALYMTAVTAQGDGGNTAFLYVEQMAYAQGCVFSDGGGVPRPDAGFKGSPPVLVDGTASFVDCTFRRTAGVFVGAQSDKAHVLEARDSSTAVRLERCAFTDNPVDTQLLRVNSSSSLFADDPALTVWDSAFNATFPLEPLSSVPARPLFLRPSDAWFVETQQTVLAPPPPVAGGESTDRAHSIAATAVAAVLALTLAAIGVLLWRRRRRPDRVRTKGMSSAEVTTTDDAHASSGAEGSMSGSRRHCRISTDPDGEGKPAGAPDHSATPPPPPPPPVRPAADPSGKSDHALVTTIESSASICSTNPAAATTSPPPGLVVTSSASNAAPPAPAGSSTPSNALGASVSNPVNGVGAAASASTEAADRCGTSARALAPPSSGGDSSAAAPSTKVITTPHTAPLHLPPPLSFHSLSSIALAAAGPESRGDRAAPPTGLPLLQKFSSVATCQSTTQVSVEDEAPPPPPRPPPPQGASLAQRMEHVQYQLDTLEGLEVLDGLVLQRGHGSRLRGGQAVIQFAKEKETHEEFAVKVFVSRRAFEDEAQLYEAESCPLGQFLPQVRDIVPNRDGRLSDAGGTPLPPCIVMEKGESLDVWMLRCADTGIDMVTGLQVVTHISQRLLALHSAGYVHRDLKPSNIMWLPRGNRWTLIDFGCAARAGAVAPLSFSLAYAAPEVIAASQAGAKTIEVTAAMDAWALGVVALELFSNDAAIDLIEGSAMVRKRICGELPLPWEDPDKSPALFRSLGRFKGAVMALLRRDAAQRISVADFVRQARRVLTHTTNTTNSVC